MYARLLDFYVRNESDSEKAELPPSTPDATGWMELLGSFLNGTHKESQAAEKYFRSRSRQLVEAAANDPDTGFRADLLSAEGATSTYGRRLAETLSAAFEQVAGGNRLAEFLSSALMIDEPNGLARRRRITLARSLAKSQTRTADAISFVLRHRPRISRSPAPASPRQGP